jgi:alkaline phosphatase
LANAEHSSEYVAAKLSNHLAEAGKHDDDSKNKAYIRKTLLEKDLGISDATDEEVNALLHPEAGVSPQYFFADMISRRAQIGWSTHGHSGQFNASQQYHIL